MRGIARQQRGFAQHPREAQKEGGLARIGGHIRTDKTLNFLFDQARKEAGKPETETT